MTTTIDTLPNTLQHSVLTLLTWDHDGARLVKNAMPLEVWKSDQGIFRLVERIYSFVDNYNKAPCAHVYDIILDLNVKDEQRSNLEAVARSCEMRSVDLNRDYVLSSLEKFHRQSLLRAAVQEALPLVDAGRLDDAEALIHRTLKKRLDVFDRGSTLPDILNTLIEQFDSKDEDEDRDYVKLDMAPLDERKLVPTRKEMYLFVAPAKKGKSWFLIHVGKQALIRQKRVLHVTLEMSEQVVGTRYLQSLHAASKRPVLVRDRVTINENGFARPRPEENPLLLSEKAGLNRLEGKLSDHKDHNRNLIIKQFPTSSLTINELKAYLDNLELKERFVPDVLILDYADLMRFDTNNYRISLGSLYRELRGLVVERNMILVTASQSNREGAKVKRIEGVNIAEDYSKIAIADTVISYNQEDTERDLGLARLFVSNGRSEEDRFQVLLSQNYATGQFALKAVHFDNRWEQQLEQAKATLGGVE